MRRAESRHRIAAAGAAALIEAAAAVLLWQGLAATGRLPTLGETLNAVTLSTPQPPRPVPPQPTEPHTGRRADPGEAGLHALRAPVYTPMAPLLPSTSPIPTSPLPQTGQAPTAGTALAGTGPGSGASGSGTGAGTGDGAGGDGAVWIGGRITGADYPRAARDAGAHGTTAVEIAVDAHGHPSGCRVTGSSGNADLDAATCRLILRRFRFTPARDEAGRAVPDSVDYEQEWTVAALAD